MVQVIVPELEATPVVAKVLEGPTENPNGNVTQAEFASSQVSVGSEVLDALGSLVEKCMRSSRLHTGTEYRKLRFFSGRQPTPSGEDDFEEWMEQATQALDEWDVPETQKKQRIAESLRGAASGAVRNLKLSQPECTAEDYLKVLQDVFGQTDKVSDLMYKFEHTYQADGEKLSEYMWRLDTILHQLLQKKGLDPKAIDKIRVQQVLHGARALDPIMIQLRTRKDSDTLKYPELMRIVREEEALLEAKAQTEISVTTRAQGRSKPPLPVQVGVVSQSAAVTDQEFLQLQGQVSMMFENFTQLAQSQSQLIQTVQEMTKSQAELKEALEQSSWNKPMSTGQLPKRPKETNLKKILHTPQGQKLYCYCCGEEGHMKRQCRNAKNPEKVIGQLLAEKQQGNFRGPQ